ncbi:MAG: hypothetical protein AAFX99_18055 [Myxococcota bacterium]
MDDHVCSGEDARPARCRVIDLNGEREERCSLKIEGTYDRQFARVGVDGQRAVGSLCELPRG